MALSRFPGASKTSLLRVGALVYLNEIALILALDIDGTDTYTSNLLYQYL